MKRIIVIIAILSAFTSFDNTLIVQTGHIKRDPILFAEDNVFIKGVKDWGYQLQGYSPELEPINDSKFDLIVMDYSFSGGPEDEFTEDDINTLKFDGPCKRKIILAYMSIGEAEAFRFYFRSMPKDLLFEKPNPQFPDNFKVRFWDERWQKIIFGNPDDGPDKSYLDRIIDADFDGVYLDIIDAYEFWGPEEIRGNSERETAARDMVDLVTRIADYARNTRGKADFIVVPQNGPGIIAPSSYPFADDPESEAELQKQRYFASINAIGAEDTFFFGPKENNNPLNPQEETIKLLNIFRDAGKNVLAVDYVQTQEKIDIFYDLAKGMGYIPYATVRALDQLTINSSHQPECNDMITVAPSPTPTDITPLPTPAQINTPLPFPSPGPTPLPQPPEGKSFILRCEKEIVIRLGGIEVLPLKVGDTIGCTLTLAHGLFDPAKEGVDVSTNLRTGDIVSIQIDPAKGVTNREGQLEFTITAIEKGIDWVACAIPDENGDVEFSKKAYDNGNAWGMFVEVRE